MSNIKTCLNVDNFFIFIFLKMRVIPFDPIYPEMRRKDRRFKSFQNLWVKTKLSIKFQLFTIKNGPKWFY